MSTTDPYVPFINMLCIEDKNAMNCGSDEADGGASMDPPQPLLPLAAAGQM